MPARPERPAVDDAIAAWSGHRNGIRDGNVSDGHYHLCLLPFDLATH